MKRFILGILSLSILVNPYLTYAEEITVSGNAADSSNNVNISSSQSNEVAQTNNAQVSNQVELSSNTGDNTASENNGGDVNIDTGNANATSEIVNAGINQSYTQIDCCPQDTTLQIKGNGSDSNNNITYSQNSNTNVNVNNSASINNYVKGTANTGYNTANENNYGSVSIVTGNIDAQDVIKNTSINISEVKAPNGVGGSVYISVNGNSDSSNNSVNLTNESSININVQNSADIVNNSQWDLNTGGNKANKNNGGDVEIETGDIVFRSTIENTGVNVSIVDVNCCEEEKGPPPDSNPPPTTPPTNNPGNGGGGGGQGGSSSGPSAGAVLGQILPVTGNYSMVLFLIGNIAMLFLGGYLRLRSGRSPNLLFAP